MDTNTTPSGIPYLAYLSGLNLGQGGASGVTDPSLSGQTASGKGGPGATGGLGLDELSQLLAAQQSADTASLGAGASLLSGIGGLGGFGNIGQGAGSYFQAGGVQSGQQPLSQRSGAGTGIAGQTGGQLDPMAILRQALGLVQKGAGLIPDQPGAYGTAGNTGVSLSDQLRSGQAGVSSPFVGMEDPNALGVPPGFQDPNALGVPPGFMGSAGGYGSPDISMTNTSPGVIPPGLAALGVTSDNLPQFLSAMSSMSPEAAMQFQAELSMGGNPSMGSTLSGYQASTPATSPTNIGGMVQGGASAGLGLLNLLQGIQSGNIQQGIGGGAQGIGGLASLLQSAPELAQALGISGGALGAIGQGAGGIGSALSLAGGIQAMLNGQYGPGAVQLASGLVSAYPQIASLVGTGTTAGTAGASASALSALGAIYGLMGQGDPTGGAQAGAALTGLGATAPTALASSLGPALAGTVGGTLGAVAPIVAAIISYFGNEDIVNAQRSWANRGQPVTALKERAESGIGGANTMFDQIAQQNITDPNALMQALATGANALHGAYWSPQGAGSNPYTIGEYFKKTGEDSTGYQTGVQKLQDSLFNQIQQLYGLGITPDQFGALNVNPLWGEPHLGGTPVAFNRPGMDLANLSQMNAGQAATATGSWLSPTATNLATGGPLMSMLAYLNPTLYRQIGGGFNYTAPLIQEELARQQDYSNLINQQVYQDFTSGGG